MTPDHLLLDLVRLGLGADTGSIRLFARRLLTRPPAFVESKEAFVRSLKELLAQDIPSVARASVLSVERPPSPSLLESFVPGDPRSPILGISEQAAIESVIEEREKWELLAAGGQEPTKTVLLTGSPGVGKTMTAYHLAVRLRLPLFRIDVASVVSSFLGKTGQNLKVALDHAKAHPCVLLLDEFDALAKRRDDTSDVGELKRIVNVLLIELDHWQPSSLLVAATNHPDLLDPAIWRRFDRVINLGMPSDEAREMLARRLIDDAGLTASRTSVVLLSLLSARLAGSETVRLTRTAIRATLLASETSIDKAVLETAKRELAAAHSWDVATMHAFCDLASRLGLPQRQVAGLLGVSHVTVGRALKRSPTRLAQGRGRS